MWELIRENRRKSIVLLIAMAFCLLLLGYLLGKAFLPPDGWILGILMALIVWLILTVMSYFAGDSLILLSAGARAVSKDEYPQLYNVVEEMQIAANLKGMPKIYVMNEAAPNAFATGRNPKQSSIAVTRGLVLKMNRDQLQGVIAHEMSHILNRDIQFVTMAGVLLGSIVMISDFFKRFLWFGGGSSSRRYSSSSRSSKAGGSSGAIIMLIAIAFLILSPILARLLYFAISRKREYLADATAARLTRYPEGLASALEVISKTNFPVICANTVTAPMFIVNPLEVKGLQLADLTSTHPPISERISILRKMSHGADLANYQSAFSKIKGRSISIIPASGIRTSVNIPIREPLDTAEKQSTKSQFRDIGDLSRAINNYLFLICTCGLKIKIPPGFDKPKITCPKCGLQLDVPVGEIAAAVTIADALGKPNEPPPPVKEGDEKPMVYKKTTDGWETFMCKCGAPIQLSPAFRASHIQCRLCNRLISIER
jgi:heat shock protein HtpX